MKRVNKIFSVFLAILMVVCALPVSASAQDVTLTIEPSKNDVKAGDTVTVNIVLSGNSDLNYLAADLVYDNSKLQYVSDNADEESNNLVINPEYANNKIRIVAANVESIAAGSVILSVEFSVLLSSCSSISLDIIDSGDNNFNEVSIETSLVLLHSYGDWNILSEPDCETTGQKIKACSCGEVISESIAALGHDYATEYTVDSEATCTEKGSKSQHCSRCDSKQNVTEIPAKGHTEEEIPGDSPTCTETGLTEGVKCSVCNKTLVEQNVVAATGHNYKEEITKTPTHTENGEKTFTCQSCGDTYKETIMADGDHKHVSSVTKEPTCTEKGVMTYICACGDNYTEEIPAKGHTEETILAVAPTCTKTGLTAGVKCSVCGETLTAQTVVPAKGHTEETISAVEPTCTQTGLTTGTKCSVCGETLTAQTVVPAKGHTPTTIPGVAPTCTETGLTEGTKCSTCGETIVAQTEIPVTGHIPTEDGHCETCEEKICDHNCHKSGIVGFFWKIGNFFNKLFGIKQYCDCGWAHY